MRSPSRIPSFWVLSILAVGSVVACSEDPAAGGTGAGGDAAGSSQTAGTGTATGTGTGTGTGAGTGTGTGAGAGTGTGGAGPLPEPSLTALGATFVIPSHASTSPKRFVDAAHDGVNDVYLVVNGNAAVSGSFLDAEGVSLAAPITIAETAAWVQGVRVAQGGGGFLVAWHDNRVDPNVAYPRARIVRWADGAPAFGGPDFALGADPTWSEMAPAIAFSPASQCFLVAWQTAATSDLRAQLVSADGALVGSEIVVTSDPDWQSDAAIAHNPVLDEFLLVHTHAGAAAEVRAQRIRATDGALVGPPVTVASASGTWAAQAGFVPATGRYLVAWFDGAVGGQVLTQDLVLEGPKLALVPGYGSYDGLAMGFSQVTGTFAAVLHGPSDEDFAAAFGPLGAQSAVVQATESPGVEGHFNPRVVAHSTRSEWLLVTSRGFAEVEGQRLAP